MGQRIEKGSGRSRGEEGKGSKIEGVKREGLTDGEGRTEQEEKRVKKTDGKGDEKEARVKEGRESRKGGRCCSRDRGKK